MAAFARSLARQRAESHVGLVFLVSGFSPQLMRYLWTHFSGLNAAAERFAASGLVGLEWVWGAKTLFTARDHPDLRAEPSADAPHG